MVGWVTVCRSVRPPASRSRPKIQLIPADFTIAAAPALGLRRGPRLASRSADDTASQTTGEIEDAWKTKRLTGAALACVSAALFTFTACSSRPGGTEETTAIETADGAIAVDTFTTTATVTGIDADRHELTLATQNGRREKYKAALDSSLQTAIRIGDRVTAVLTEEVAVTLGKGAGPIGTSGGGVALAPVGSKPGAVIVDTSEITAKVIGIDVRRHKLTFELPDGTTRTVKAGRKIDLSAVQPGETVTMQVGESLAVTVEKP